jgi:hypothetical protein
MHVAHMRSASSAHAVSPVKLQFTEAGGAVATTAVSRGPRTSPAAASRREANGGGGRWSGDDAHVTGGTPSAHVTGGTPSAHVTGGTPSAHVTGGTPSAQAANTGSADPLQASASSSVSIFDQPTQDISERLSPFEAETQAVHVQLEGPLNAASSGSTNRSVMVSSLTQHTARACASRYTVELIGISFASCSIIQIAVF